jgi:hypothetical protein
VIFDYILEEIAYYGVGNVRYEPFGDAVERFLGFERNAVREEKLKVKLRYRLGIVEEIVE